VHKFAFFALCAAVGTSEAILQLTGLLPHAVHPPKHPWNDPRPHGHFLDLSWLETTMLLDYLTTMGMRYSEAQLVLMHHQYTCQTFDDTNAVVN
jgi:hypothetical protein